MTTAKISLEQMSIYVNFMKELLTRYKRNRVIKNCNFKTDTAKALEMEILIFKGNSRNSFFFRSYDLLPYARLLLIRSNLDNSLKTNIIIGS